MFTLWGLEDKRARNGRKVVVRIYLEGTDAYIWRKSVKHPLEIKNGRYGAEQSIRGIFVLYNIDLDTVKTRRDLACMLRDNGLLKGDSYSYDVPESLRKPIDKVCGSIHLSDIDHDAKPQTEQQSSDSNVIQLSDYFKKNK